MEWLCYTCEYKDNNWDEEPCDDCTGLYYRRKDFESRAEGCPYAYKNKVGAIICKAHNARCYQFDDRRCKKSKAR